MSERKLAVSGSFYPDSKNELNKYIEHFNTILEKNSFNIDNNINTKAIIVPHAGYIYSGFTANIAYRYIPKNIENIIVIGPSHKYGFGGASVAVYDKYPTPFGELDINKELSKNIIQKYSFLDFYDEVHCEHSTEVQFPFIKKYCEDKKVVEIVYSKIDYKEISKVIEYLLEDEKNFIIISTDLSHFYDIKKANELDNICLNSIEKKDISMIEKGCEACGMIGVKAILEVCNKKAFETKILDYRTSADASNDEKRVVGYTSALIY